MLVMNEDKKDIFISPFDGTNKRDRKGNLIPWKRCTHTPGCQKKIASWNFKGKENKYYLGHQALGARNPRWNNGEYIDEDGYKHIRSPTHPFKDIRGYILKSHLVYEIYMTLKTGKIFYIPKGYDIHHRDWNTLNDVPLNLQMLSKKEHDSLKDGQRYKPFDFSDRRCFHCGIDHETYMNRSKHYNWYEYKESFFICGPCYNTKHFWGDES